MKHIFMSFMAFDGGKSGISEYMIQTLEHLSKTNRVTILILKEDDTTLTIKNENIERIVVSNFLKKPIINMLWHLFFLPLFTNWKKYDFAFLPAANRRIFAYYPIYTIATFHDLSQYHIENKYDRFRTLYIKKVIPYFIKKVDKIVSVSQSTKEDLKKYYNLKDQHIVVNHSGYEKNSFNSVTENIPLPFTSKKPYFLYVARVEHPGKNHLNLIKAFELLPQEIKDSYNLVCAGSLWSGSDTVVDYIENSEDKNAIIFTGFVKNEQLPTLYKKASLYIFPSYYEGFGFPLLEAMACGIPTLCANRSSLPEIGAEAVETFNPDDYKKISFLIESVVSDEQKKSIMISKGLEVVQRFDWNKHVEKIEGIYEARNHF